jgi:hypothetical protein
MSEENKSNEELSKEIEILDKTSGESHSVEEGTQVEAKSEDRPEWLDDKFKNPEDMAKAYHELQKEFSSRKPNEEEVKADNEEEIKTEDNKEEENTDVSTEKKDEKVEVDLSDINLESKVTDIASKLTESGIDTLKIFEELRNDGKLSANSQELFKEKFGDDARKVLEDTIFVSEVAEKYQAKQEQELYTVVGDEENYNTIINFFANNIEQYSEEVNDYNEAFNSGDAMATKLALKVLKGTYESNNGSIKSRKVNSNSKVNGQIQGDIFKSQAEYNAEMGANYSKYKSDANYRAELDVKLEKSMKFW